MIVCHALICAVQFAPIGLPALAMAQTIDARLGAVRVHVPPWAVSGRNSGDRVHHSRHPFMRGFAALGLVLLLFASAPDARALVIGVAESSEITQLPTYGVEDYRGSKRHARLLEVLEGWKTIGVDFGVLVGDNVGNSTAGWPPLLQAIEDSGVTVYMAVGTHDWVNQVPSGGGSHPDSCFNLKPQEQVPSCPNMLYFLDYLQNTHGYDRPWYSFEQDGALFAFLADEMYDSRGWNGGGISDVHDEQFYWFRDLVAANTDKPIVVFFHHPVYLTVAGTNSSLLNRQGWRPREGEEDGDTVSITFGGTQVIRAGPDFDPRRVTVGSEFQIQGEVEWYEIAAIDGDELTLTTPYQGTTEPVALFWAGGHYNELNQIMKDPGNSIEVVMSGHTSGDFQYVWAGLSQMEIINGKIFAFSGTIAASSTIPSWRAPKGDFYVGSTTAFLTQTVDSYKIRTGAMIRPTYLGDDIEVIDVSWADTLGGISTVTLASSPDISFDRIGVTVWTNRTEQFTQTRVVKVQVAGEQSVEVVSFNYATGWQSGTLLDGSFDDLDFPDSDLTGAVLEIDGSTAQLTPSSTHGVALYGEDDQHFYSVEVELERVSGGGGGIAFRAQDGSNYYYFELDESSQTFKLGKSQAGTLITLAEVSPGAPLVDEYTLKVRVQDHLIQAFVDDQPAIYIYDTSYPTGRYGLFSRSVGGTDFEDLEVIGDIRPFVAAEPVPSISLPGLALFAGMVLGIGGWARRKS